jgi:hypothetical protein
MLITQESIRIDARFSGIPHIVHGGYLAGLMARAIGADAAETRLRRPVPTDRALTLIADGDSAELHDGEQVLARSESIDRDFEVPPPVTLAQARTAAERFPGRDRHPFPRCLVCGTDHEDGLRIFPGLVRGHRLVAAPWVPAGDGSIAPELAWAALDCPQLWALIANAPAGTPDRVVTAAFAGRQVRSVIAGEPHVVIAWPIARTERAWRAGAAVFGPDGELSIAGVQTAALAPWGVPLDIDRHKEEQ